MARGWESKAVEDQQAEAARRAEQRDFRLLSSAEVALEQRRESLRLTQSRLREQFERARSAAHRQQLVDALQQLEAELAQLPPAIN